MAVNRHWRIVNGERHTMTVKVEAQNVGMSYGENAVLNGIDLAIEPGEFFALLGPSGSGKSTLLRIIAGFNPAQTGRILIDGRDVTRIPPWQRNVGMVFQNYALWPHMTVRQNVAFGLEERRLPKNEIAAKVEAALALVDLAEFSKRRPSQLSGGQQQRVALARTLAIEPQVLLLDEPLSNLDAKLRVQMRTELRALQRKLGITTIFVTHDQEEAMTTSDRVAVMDHGVIQQVGTPMALYDEPANRFVASFVGSINLLRGNVEKAASGETAFDSPVLGVVALPHINAAAGPADMAIRPHAIQLSQSAGDPRFLWTEGIIVNREFMGEFVRYTTRIADAVLIVDQPHYSGHTLFAPGDRPRVGFDLAQIRLLADA
jgi:iron(III) transport system ATP-binding protein